MSGTQKTAINPSSGTLCCTDCTGAQLAKVVSTELNLSIHQLTLWTDSTTVLTWLHSDSSQFKVFVGTRVAEIQDITDQHTWRYVPSTHNPADDITWGKSLCKLGPDSHWYQGPSFIKNPPYMWLEIPHLVVAEEDELRKTVPCVLTCFTASLSFGDISQSKTFEELLSRGPVMRQQAIVRQLMPTKWLKSVFYSKLRSS